MKIWKTGCSTSLSEYYLTANCPESEQDARCSNGLWVPSCLKNENAARIQPKNHDNILKNLGS